VGTEPIVTGQKWAPNGIQGTRSPLLLLLLLLFPLLLLLLLPPLGIPMLLLMLLRPLLALLSLPLMPLLTLPLALGAQSPVPSPGRDTGGTPGCAPPEMSCRGGECLGGRLLEGAEAWGGFPWCTAGVLGVPISHLSSHLGRISDSCAPEGPSRGEEETHTSGNPPAGAVPVLCCCHTVLYCCFCSICSLPGLCCPLPSAPVLPCPVLLSGAPKRTQPRAPGSIRAGVQAGLTLLSVS